MSWAGRRAVLAVFALSALALAASQAAAPQSGGDDGSLRGTCRVHVVNNTDLAPAFGRAASSVRVLQAVPIVDVAVVLQVQHHNISALEVVLSAGARAGEALRRVILKAPAPAGTAGAGGANMVQSIFSDNAPIPFPHLAAAAPFTGVFKPAEPLAPFAQPAGGVLAGAGGSGGVWTVSVADTTAAGRSPLKVVGWELWLCGAAPLVDPAAAINATALDGADQAAAGGATQAVVKRVATASAQSLAQQAEAAVQFKYDSGTQALNAFVDAKLFPLLSGAKDALSAAFPNQASAIDAWMAQITERLLALPNALGYSVSVNGTYELPDTSAATKDFSSTLLRCYNDLYWCYSQSALSGRLALDLALEFRNRTVVALGGYEDASDAVQAALDAFREGNPELASWGEVLAQDSIEALYAYAALDAACTWAEVRLDAAVRLAILLSPVVVNIDPQIAVAQAYQLVVDIVQEVISFLLAVPYAVDARINNELAPGEGIVLAVDRMFSALQGIVDTASQGVVRAAEQRTSALADNGAPLVSALRGANQRFTESLTSASPLLGAVYKSATEPLDAAAGSLVDSTRASLANFFRQQDGLQVLQSQLVESVGALGDVASGLAQGLAGALQGAAKVLEPLPGPMPIELLATIRNDTQALLGAATERLGVLVPVAELESAQAILDATVQALLSIIETNVEALTTSDAAASIADSLSALAGGVAAVGDQVGAGVQQLTDGFPGPLANATLEALKLQAQAAVDDATAVFDSLTATFPQLDPEAVLSALDGTLQQLLSGARDAVGGFGVLAPFDAAAQLGAQAVPVLEEVAAVIGAGLPSLPIVPGTEGLVAELEKGVGDLLSGFADGVKGLAEAVPEQPPIKDIAADLAGRLADASTTLAKVPVAFVELAAIPQDAAIKALDTTNKLLTGVAKDLQSSSGAASDLAQALLAGPLKGAADALAAGASTIEAQLKPLVDLLPDLDTAATAVLDPAFALLDGAVTDASGAALVALDSISKGVVAGTQTVLGGLTQALLAAQEQLAAVLAQLAAGAKALEGGGAGADAVAQLVGAVEAVQGQLGEAVGRLPEQTPLLGAILAPPDAGATTAAAVQQLAASIEALTGGEAAANASELQRVVLEGRNLLSSLLPSSQAVAGPLTVQGLQQAVQAGLVSAAQEVLSG